MSLAGPIGQDQQRDSGGSGQFSASGLPLVGSVGEVGAQAWAASGSSTPAPGESAYGPENHVFRAFVHYPAGHPDAGFHDLEPQVSGADGWELETAMGINDHGVIVGNGTYLGESRSFALHPVRQREVDRILSFITLFGGVTAGGAGTGIIPGWPAGAYPITTVARPASSPARPAAERRPR